MSTLLKGIDVLLHVRDAAEGLDPFDAPIHGTDTVTVHNVIVCPADSSDAVSGESLNGKQIAYNLYIPKGDCHDWENTELEFFGKLWRTVGYPKEYIEALLPLDWNKTIRVERHE